MLVSLIVCYLLLVTECKPIVDLAIIVDSSGSISRRNWILMKDFLKQLADEFDISPSGTHVAAVAYSTNPKVVFKFNTLQGSQLNADEVKKLLDSIPHQRGLTYIDRALLFADSVIFTVDNGMRPQVTKVKYCPKPKYYPKPRSFWENLGTLYS